MKLTHKHHKIQLRWTKKLIIKKIRWKKNKVINNNWKKGQPKVERMLKKGLTYLKLQNKQRAIREEPAYTSTCRLWKGAAPNLNQKT